MLKLRFEYKVSKHRHTVTAVGNR